MLLSVTIWYKITKKERKKKREGKKRKRKKEIVGVLNPINEITHSFYSFGNDLRKNHILLTLKNPLPHNQSYFNVYIHVFFSLADSFLLFIVSGRCILIPSLCIFLCLKRGKIMSNKNSISPQQQIGINMQSMPKNRVWKAKEPRILFVLFLFQRKESRSSINILQTSHSSMLYSPL